MAKVKSKPAGKLPTKPNGQRQSSLSPEQREQILQLLQVRPIVPDAEIARRVQCSVFAIRHLRSVVESQDELAARVVRTYQRRFTKELPPGERVKVYAGIVRGEYEAKTAYARLKSLERIEGLEGIVTKKEQKEAESGPAPQAPGAVFVIAGGTVNVHPVQSAPLPVVVEAESQEVPLLTEDTTHDGSAS